MPYKSAADFVPGDEWIEGPERVRMVRALPCPIPSIVRIRVATMAGAESVHDYYRVNRRMILPARRLD
jgi:hypothetical protein